MAILNEMVISQLGALIPAANRWYTFAPSLEVQALGLLVHGFMAKVTQRLTLGTNVAPPAGDDDDEADAATDYKVYLSRKQRQSQAFLCEPETPKLIAVAIAVTEPCDRLSSRMQHLDSLSHGFSELADPNGPVHECLVGLSNLACPSIESSPGHLDVIQRARLCF